MEKGKQVDLGEGSKGMNRREEQGRDGERERGRMRREEDSWLFCGAFLVA